MVYNKGCLCKQIALFYKINHGDGGFGLFLFFAPGNSQGMFRMFPCYFERIGELSAIE